MNQRHLILGLGLRLFLTLLLLSTCGGCLEYGSDGYYLYYLPTILGIGLFFVGQSILISADRKKATGRTGLIPSERHRFAVSFPLAAGILWFLSLLLGVPWDTFFFWYLFFLPALAVVGAFQYMGVSETGVAVVWVVAPIAQYVGYGVVLDGVRWTRNLRSRAWWLAGTALCLLVFVLCFTIEAYLADPDTTYPGALELSVILGIHGLLIALLIWRAVIWWRRVPRRTTTGGAKRSSTESAPEERPAGNGEGTP